MARQEILNAEPIRRIADTIVEEHETAKPRPISVSVHLIELNGEPILEIQRPEVI